MKNHTLSCIFLTASARGKERDFPLSAFHTNSMFAPEGKPELFLPSYWVSSSFSSLTYLLSVSVSSWSLQASSPQFLPTLTRVSTQPLPEQWFTENVRSTASGKLMKHFINLSTEEILSAQTPRHEIRVWHRHSWIEFFRWLVWKEGFDLHSQTDCETAVNWVSGGGESASFSHECFTDLIQSNNFQKCKGSKISTEIFTFLSNNWYLKILRQKCTETHVKYFFLKRVMKKEEITYRFLKYCHQFFKILQVLQRNVFCFQTDTPRHKWILCTAV